VPAESLAGLTETVRFWFVFSDPEGEMLSQFAPPLCTETLAVNAVRLEARTDSVWDGGAPPPAVAVKVNEVGLTVRTLPPPSCAIDAQANPAIRTVNLKTESERGILPPCSDMLLALRAWPNTMHLCAYSQCKIYRNSSIAVVFVTL
jgi:hypothetical protein